MMLEKVKLVRDADGARCLACPALWDEFTNQSVPWSWRDSQWMHERGTDHRTEMFRRVS